MLFIKRRVIASVVQNSSRCNQVHRKVKENFRPLNYLEGVIRSGHIAGGFARYRYDLRTHMQQQQQAAAALAAQQMPIEKTGTTVGRGEATNGVVQQLVHQIQHLPHTSTSSQRASTSMSGIR